MLTIEPPVDNTTKKLDLLKFAWSKYDAKKYKLGGNQKQIMINAAFAYPIFWTVWCLMFPSFKIYFK